MSLVKTFTAGDVTVNAAMPSAIEQDELLSLVSAQFIAHAANVYKNGGELGVKDVTLLLTAVPHHIKQRIAEVLLSKAMTAGTNTKITVNDFPGKMMTLNTLLAELFLWVYADFFDYVQNANKDE
ncbi:hypothetical protein RCIP0093_00028 [Klebsiella phage RCIP0093]